MIEKVGRKLHDRHTDKSAQMWWHGFKWRHFDRDFLKLCMVPVQWLVGSLQSSRLPLWGDVLRLILVWKLANLERFEVHRHLKPCESLYLLADHGSSLVWCRNWTLLFKSIVSKLIRLWQINYTPLCTPASTWNGTKSRNQWRRRTLNHWYRNLLWKSRDRSQINGRQYPISEGTQTIESESERESARPRTWQWTGSLA